MRERFSQAGILEREILSSWKVFYYSEKKGGCSKSNSSRTIKDREIGKKATRHIFLEIEIFRVQYSLYCMDPYNHRDSI